MTYHPRPARSTAATGVLASVTVRAVDSCCYNGTAIRMYANNVIVSIVQRTDDVAPWVQINHCRLAALVEERARTVRLTVADEDTPGGVWVKIGRPSWLALLEQAERTRPGTRDALTRHLQGAA